MLDAFKMAGALAGLMKNKDQIQASVQKTRERLSHMRITGTGGGGAVRAIASGELTLISVEITPGAISALASGDDARRMVEGLIVEAVNSAFDQAKEAAQREIGKEAQALGLPTDLPGLSGLMGGR
jgi:nucleoid-associated protein EbfC